MMKRAADGSIKNVKPSRCRVESVKAGGQGYLSFRDFTQPVWSRQRAFKGSSDHPSRKEHTPVQKVFQTGLVIDT